MNIDQAQVIVTRMFQRLLNVFIAASGDVDFKSKTVEGILEEADRIADTVESLGLRSEEFLEAAQTMEETLGLDGCELFTVDFLRNSDKFTEKQIQALRESGKLR